MDEPVEEPNGPGAEAHVIDIDGLWKLCTDALRDQVSESSWQAYLSGLSLQSFGETELVLGVPNSLVRERIESRFLGLIEDTVTATVGHPIAVRLDVLPVELNHHHPAVEPAAEPLAAPTTSTAPTASSRASQATTSAARSALDSRYTFETFVIASSNRFAHAAALSVAESPARSYNPLFIYGDAGLGKTHLLHAIGNYVRENYPERYVKYVSTETFLNEFVDAIKTNKTSEFKTRYRQCDVLLVDDIQFLENKEAIQEEFFHTFNFLYNGHAQIVLTSDRPPRSLATLEDRLKSRFAMGLTTDIQTPDLETRSAILKRKSEDAHVQIPEEVIEFIATSITENIRELEGALTRLAAYSSLNGIPISLNLAETVLSDLVSNRPGHLSRSPEEVIAATAALFGVKPEEITGNSRKRPIATARQVAMYVMRELTELSYPQIGRAFGGKDHTTVMHGVQRVQLMMNSSIETFEQVDKLFKSLRGPR